jgi:hypothetical protein
MPLIRWCRLAALFLIVGLVLSPLSAVAATVPMLIAFDVATWSTATTAHGRQDAVRHETERTRVTAYDDATLGCDDASNPRTTAGFRNVRAYDTALELTERREVAEGAIYDAPAATAAAGGAGRASEEWIPGPVERGGHLRNVEGDWGSGRARERV